MAESSLKEQLGNAVKDAMRNKEKDRLVTLRMAQAAVKQIEIDERRIHAGNGCRRGVSFEDFTAEDRLTKLLRVATKIGLCKNECHDTEQSDHRTSSRHSNEERRRPDAETIMKVGLSQPRLAGAPKSESIPEDTRMREQSRDCHRHEHDTKYGNNDDAETVRHGEIVM